MVEHIVKRSNNINLATVSQLPNKPGDSNSVDISTFFVIIFICFLFSGCFVIFDGCLLDGTASIELDGRININEASAVSMMRLPGIGISKAESIILYRQNCGGQKAFENSQDLTHVHGIGVKTVDSVREYIRFE